MLLCVVSLVLWGLLLLKGRWRSKLVRRRRAEML